MKIVADENCEAEIVTGLRKLGHDVASITELAPGMNDEEIFAWAHREGRVLLTSDHDFGLIAEHARLRPAAVILMRLERVSSPSRVRIALEAITALGESVSQQFFVVEPHQIRGRAYEA
ncbi:MAG TPA: DUF5615 family PIN-like protein [Rhizomicrobium sp.]|jgi:predicted nuclease of predicted toxin-antitoxin system|nr:DUF5615 family PIN-like protein [Rhizomicrobium sp.]